MSCRESTPRPDPRAPWPDWFEWKPSRIWGYDFTHFTRARRVAVAVLDMVSRRWLSTLVSAEESCTQVEAAFIAALDEEGSPSASTPGCSPRYRGGTATPAELDGRRPTACRC